MANPCQMNLDASKKKWCRKAIGCDCLCAMEKSKDDGAHIFFFVTIFCRFVTHLSFCHSFIGSGLEVRIRSPD